MDKFTIREIAFGENFDPLTIHKEAPFTQAEFYGQWQNSLNREVKRFVISDQTGEVAYFQLIRYLLFGKLSYLYIPYGPVSKSYSNDLLFFLKEELKKIAKKNNAVFIRLDFTPTDDEFDFGKFFTKASLSTYHSAHFQPRQEWFLRLNDTEEELLKRMHEKTRYSIRLAERKGIKGEIVSNNFSEYFEIFYNLMLETAKRNEFSLHQKKYYENIFNNLEKIKGSYLSVARHEEKILAIDLVVVYGNTANYVFGGSSNEERNRMPTYLAQWAAICQAKKLGLKNYNFGGISTDNSIYKGWEGLSNFKRKFGGYEFKHPEFFDLVSQPVLYYFYTLRKYLLHKLKR